MRVKIGNDWFECTAEQPIMVVLTDGDKRNIANMADGCTRYAIFDDADEMSADEKFAWMSEE